MSMFAAWVVYPLVLLALCTGLGLLVDALCGRRLPGTLVPPVGLAAIVVIGQFTTLGDATAEFTAPLICFLAVLGAGFAFPWRFSRPGAWEVAAPLAVFAVLAAPVVFSGHPTFAGYTKLDDTATWLALTDRAMEHGRDLTGLEPSTYRATLEANLSDGHPIGIFIPFGAAQKLVGGDLAWVFQPYLAFLATMLALCLWQIVSGLLRRSWLRAVAVFVAAQPALLFGYALWGGIEELGAAVFVALAAAVAPALLRADSSRAAAVLALAGGGLVGVLNIGGLVWVAPMLLALAYLAIRALGTREAGARAMVFAIALVVFALPLLTTGGLSPFRSGLTGESELGKLVAPLNPFQVLGIWPSGDFRVAPSASVAGAVLIALGVLAALLGFRAAWRRRVTTMLLFSTSLLAAAAAIVLVASPWVDGKALATAAPAALALAICGAIATARLNRAIGIVLAIAVAGGVLWSNVLAYGGVDLAPYEQLTELQRIGEEYAGQGPALMTEYNPYGARHFLRGLDGEEEGETVDTDRLDAAGLYEFPTLVLRRSPLRSRPPLIYHLAWTGNYYEVWQRLPTPTLLPSGTLPLGDRDGPTAIPDCQKVLRLSLAAAKLAAGGASLVAARHAPIYDATRGTLRVSRSGEYEAWLGGSVRGSVELFVDDRPVGEARHQLENHGGFIRLGQVRLPEGRHRARLRFGGADLHPGSGGFPRPETGPLLFTPIDAAAGRLVWVPTDEARRLCGKRWDWIETLGAN